MLLVALLSLVACGGGGNGRDSSSVSDVTTSVAAPVITSMGTDFYLTLPDHLCASTPASCTNGLVSNKLIVAGPDATTGEVTFNGVVTPFSIAAGAQSVITLDPSVVLTANETVEAKGIHVTALSPVSVHVVSENIGSADGYLALPTAGLGTSYYVMSYTSTVFTGSEFAVAATQDNTTVSITPAAAGATKPAGVAFTVLLNSGETYLFTNPAHADMTGTLVTADKPVAMFSGHRCANVPSSTGYCDYLVEQLPDVTRWGKTHHTSLFSGRTRYTARIIASQDGTAFTTIPSGLSGTLNAGQFAEFDLTGAEEFVSNNPVLVAQFMRGYADDAAGKGDPSMVLVTPAEQAVTDSTFGVHGIAGTPGAFINVVTETASLASLQLDGLALDTMLFAPIGGASIYSTGTIPVSPGVHTLQGTGAYSAFVYDYGISWNSVSYAYPVAIKLSVPVATSPAPDASGPSGCSAEHEDEHEDEHHHSDSNHRDHSGAGDYSGHHDHSIHHDYSGHHDCSGRHDHSDNGDHSDTDHKDNDDTVCDK
ncbi:MAG: hypothetical protein A2V79_01230 [Betaproteobacteria bacterium RBG_16_56_24]|nr:MAG: hypothetical protein A2V79_01230 [Betaproteobacteria bacterium RBG_16_56_24]